MLKYSLIECIDPITNEVMSFECITHVTPEDMQDVYFETKEEIFYIDSLSVRSVVDIIGILSTMLSNSFE